MAGEHERGHRVSGGRANYDQPVPGDTPNEAANYGLEAVSAYLKRRGVDFEHVVVLVRTKQAPGWPGGSTEGRTGGTAFSVQPGDEHAEALVGILLAHARAVAQAGGRELTVVDLDEPSE